MQRAFAVLGLSLALVACNGGNTLTLHLDFDTQDAAVQNELTFVALRVIGRSLGRIGEHITDQSVTTDTTGTSIRLELESSIAKDMLQVELQEPFTLALMKESDPAVAELVIPDHGGFAATGITEAHVENAIASIESDGKRGRVELKFTPEGRALMQQVFKENKGKSLGLFIRGALVSKLLVETDELKDDIVIRDITSHEIAEAFADDLTVGLHVRFLPID
jgi:preprotein translocase subunit SecD